MEGHSACSTLGPHLVLLQQPEPLASLRLVPFFVRLALCCIAPGGHISKRTQHKSSADVVCVGENGGGLKMALRAPWAEGVSRGEGAVGGHGAPLAKA